MTDTPDPLHQEQSEVDRRYARLDALRHQTADRLAQVRRVGPSGSPQNRSERDAFATLYEDRLTQLDGVEQRLVFGRLDLADGQTRYVGRVGLTDEDHASLLTDWRAPAAQAFYRATAANPEGVLRRRHVVTRRREVTGLEDEVLDLARWGEASGRLGEVAGEGALLAALAGARTGRMGDIVATIQAEQDAIIRSDLRGALVVQGGPGTGKTAVALHRAAYLLYAHRATLERSGVLVVGPSPVFLRYIDQVLPSLGETGVVTATVADLVPGVRVDATEDDAVAAVKGRAVMADVVARAVRLRQRVPAEPVAVRVEGRLVTVTPSDVRDAIARARRTGRPHNLARVTFVREMLDRLADQYVARLGFAVAPEDRAEVLEELRTTREIRIALNLAWMPLTPQRLLEDLWSRPDRLDEAARRLGPAERELLRRPAGSGWTEADVPLLDEAAELLGEDDQAERAQAAQEARRRQEEVEYARQVLSSGRGAGLVSAETLAERFAPGGPRMTTAERAGADRTWTYGHVVVDEAQELSPMAWRMLLRRVPTRSMTIVGDVAQTSGPAGARDWATVLDPVLRDSWRLAELTVNYRTPATVADAAREVAQRAGLPLSPVRSARDVPGALRVHRVALAGSTGGTGGTGGTASAVSAVVAGAEEGLALLGPDGDTDGPATAAHDGTGASAGRVAVVAAERDVAEVRAALRSSALADRLGPPGSSVLDARLAVLTPRESKGLEFDVVVLVEPAHVAADGPGDLYVAMTRPTRALVVLAAEPLPAGLDA